MQCSWPYSSSQPGTLPPTHPSPHPQAVLTNTLVHSIPPEHFPDLPSFIPMADLIFSWGSVDSESFSHSLNAAYAEIVHWRKKSFKVPFGKAGKNFVSELASLFRAFAKQSSLESVAFKAITVFAILALQKPFRSSKSKDHIACLERRLSLWRDGNLNDLVLEGRTIQQRLPKRPPSRDAQQLAHSFANLMFVGKHQSHLCALSPSRTRERFSAWTTLSTPPTHPHKK